MAFQSDLDYKECYCKICGIIFYVPVIVLKQNRDGALCPVCRGVKSNE